MVLTYVLQRRVDLVMLALGVTVSLAASAWAQDPVAIETSVKIPAADTAAESGANSARDYFEAPVMLMVGDSPLNTIAKQMYPSPAMFDIDNDGRVELVVGDIFGSLNVYENRNTSGRGDPVWSPHSPLKTSGGDPIKVSNW